MAFPGSSTSAQPPVHDTQALVALLGSLMPLLLRMQSQGAAPQGAGQSPQFGPTPTPTPTMTATPMIDHQAALSLIEDINADSLRRLSAYLESHAPRHAALEGCVPIVTQAVRCFAMRDHAQTFDLTLQAYRFIAMLQATDPQVPSVRSAEIAAVAPGPDTMVH